MVSMMDYLRVIEPYASQDLISVKAFTDIHHIARQLPPTSFYVFECRLQGDDEPVDFLTAILPTDGSRDILAGYNPALTVPEHFLTHDAWQRIQQFCRDWSDPNSVFHDTVHAFWLEFDMHETLPHRPLPSLFINLEAGHQQHPAVTEAALQTLAAQSVTRPLQENIRRCFAALPANARMTDAGFMLSRHIESVRLVIYLSPHQVMPYLAQINWPGRRSELEPIVQNLGQFTDKVCLDLDLSDELLPKVGIECPVYTNKTPYFKPEPLLAYLVQTGQCTRAKEAALRSWIGLADEETDSERWPLFLRKASHQFGAQIRSTFLRMLHHVKVVYRPDYPLETKAYLGVQHLWVKKRQAVSSEVAA